jgi:hypothetical protein
MKRSYLPALLLLVFLVITAGCPEKDGQTHRPEGSVPLSEDSSNPVSLTLTLKDADRTEGVTMRATMENRSQSPISISVCPDMLMSSVMESHILIHQEDWGIGLLDVCRTPRPCKGENTLLPPYASFASDISIPTGHLPEPLKESEFSVQLLCELEEQGPAKSNLVWVRWE